MTVEAGIYVVQESEYSLGNSGLRFILICKPRWKRPIKGEGLRKS